MPPKAQAKAGAKPPKKSKKQIEEENRVAADLARKTSDAEKVTSAQKLSISASKSINKVQGEKNSKFENANRLISEGIVAERHKLKRGSVLKAALASRRKSKEWAEFISCSGEPNVRSEKDIMRYVRNIQESLFPIENDMHLLTVDQALQCIDQVESVVASINTCKVEAVHASDTVEATWYSGAITSLRASTANLLDSSIACMLRTAEKLGPNARQEVQGQCVGSHSSVGFWGILNSKGFRSKSIEFAKLHVNLEIPKTICSHCPGMIGLRVHNTRIPQVDDSGDRTYSVSANLWVDVVTIPDAPTLQGGWAIRLVDGKSDNVTVRPYPNPELVGAPAQPCKIVWKIPSDLLCEPRPAFWTGTWSTEGIISDVKYEAGHLSFVSTRLGLFGLTQSRWMQPNWTQWLLRPVDDSVQLLIQCLDSVVTFDIDEEGVRCQQFSVPSLLPGQVLENLELRGLPLRQKSATGDRFSAVEISDFCLTCDFWRKKGEVVRIRPNHRGEVFDWLGNTDEVTEFKRVEISSKLDTVSVEGVEHASLRQCLDEIPVFKTAVLKASSVTNRTALIMQHVETMICLLDL